MKNVLPSLALLVCSSCASIVTGATDDILVTSEPRGAFFKTNLGHYGRTPKTISVDDDRTLEVLFRAKGYSSESVRVGTRPSFWIFGNALFGGPIGVLIDFVGNGFVHSSDHVHAELRRVSGSDRSADEESAEEKASPPRESFEEWSKRQDASPTTPKP